MTVRSVVDLMCREVVEVVTEYLDGAMQGVDRVRLEQHLLACPPCTAHFAQVRATLELAAGLRKETPEPEPTTGTEEDLLTLFRRWSRK
jgi:predicted anti-sigma-YlaC factor YlaD